MSGINGAEGACSGASRFVRSSPLLSRRRRRTPAAARYRVCEFSRADRFDTFYLRAAQAYMLISMPTGTSTILGVFQVIAFLPTSLARTSRRGRTYKDARHHASMLESSPSPVFLSWTKRLLLLDNHRWNPRLATPPRIPEPTQQRRAKYPDRNDRDRRELSIIRPRMISSALVR